MREHLGHGCTRTFPAGVGPKLATAALKQPVAASPSLFFRQVDDMDPEFLAVNGTITQARGGRGGGMHCARWQAGRLAGCTVKPCARAGIQQCSRANGSQPAHHCDTERHTAPPIFICTSVCRAALMCRSGACGAGLAAWVPQLPGSRWTGETFTGGRGRMAERAQLSGSGRGPASRPTVLSKGLQRLTPSE